MLGLGGHVRCPLMSLLKCRLLQFARDMRTMRTLRTSQTKLFFHGCEPNELCELTEQNYFCNSLPPTFSFLCEKMFFTGSLGSQSSQCRVQWICWCSCQLCELVTTNSYRALRTERTMRTGKQKLFFGMLYSQNGQNLSIYWKKCQFMVQ